MNSFNFSDHSMALTSADPQADSKREPRSGFVLSIVFHATLALVIFAKAAFFPGQPIAYIPSLRVDLVGLPDQLKKDLLSNPTPLPTTPAPPPQEAKKEVTPKENSKEAPKLTDEIALKKTREKNMESALSRIKALAKLSNESQKNAEAISALLKGNKISKGLSTASNARESQSANYVDVIQNALQQKWTLPMWLERQQLNAQVMIFIDSNGRLIQFKFMQASGNSQFDDAVKRTLQESQPFPAPPKDIASAMASNGVLVGFPL